MRKWDGSTAQPSLALDGVGASPCDSLASGRKPEANWTKPRGELLSELQS